MDIQITSRHFKARPSMLEYTEEALQKLSQLYDGIISADVVFEVEAHTEGKMAEITLLVYHDRLFAKETSDEFEKSVAACVEKLEKQLRKYKDKLRNERQRREQQKGAFLDDGAAIPEVESLEEDMEDIEEE